MKRPSTWSPGPRVVRIRPDDGCFCKNCGKQVGKNCHGVFEHRRGTGGVTFAGDGSATVKCHFCGTSTTFLVSARPHQSNGSR